MISATVIQDSAYLGSRLITLELEYPRFIHAEFMTHRQFSRNAASSRAIPIATMNANISSNPAQPVHWGQNKPGMQADEQITNTQDAIDIWEGACNYAVVCSNDMAKLGVHKQVANRLTEPFQHMKVVVTATEWANFFELRCHKDAQPEIQELAHIMRDAIEESRPMSIRPGDWHLPYVHREFVEHKITYSVDDVMLTLDEARKISASCCAQVSYRKTNTDLAKAIEIYDKLITMVPKHASPIEHQGTPMQYAFADYTNIWEPGITHCDRRGRLWSGNFSGFIQWRQL